MCTMFCHSVQGFRSFSTLNIICIYCMWCCRIRSVQAVQSRKSRLQKCTYAVNTGGVTRGWGAAWPWTAYSQIHSVQWINVWIIHSPLFFWTEMRRMASLNGPWVQKKKIKMPLIIVSVVLYTCKTSSPQSAEQKTQGFGDGTGDATVTVRAGNWPRCILYELTNVKSCSLSHILFATRTVAFSRRRRLGRVGILPRRGRWCCRWSASRACAGGLVTETLRIYHRVGATTARPTDYSSSDAVVHRRPPPQFAGLARSGCVLPTLETTGLSQGALPVRESGVERRRSVRPRPLSRCRRPRWRPSRAVTGLVG